MSKKFLTLVFIALMIISMAACASKSNEESSTSKEPESSSEVSKEESKEENKEPISTPEIQGTPIDYTFVSLNYMDPLVLNTEGSLDEEESNYITLEVLEDEEAVAGIDIEVDFYSATYIRSRLHGEGIDLYEYYENNAYPTKTISEIEFINYESEYWGTNYNYYVGRDEKSGANIYISHYGEIEEDVLNAVFDTMTFKLEDQGLTDPPQFWNGERITGKETAEVAVGDYTIKSTSIPFAEPLETFSTFDAVATQAVGDTILVGRESEVLKYKLVDGTLIFDSILDLQEVGFSKIDRSKSGEVYFSAFFDPLLKLDKDGNLVNLGLELDGDLALSPDGTWGVTHFLSNEVPKISITADSATSEVLIPENEAYSYGTMAVTDSFVLANVNVKDVGQRLIAFDHSGNELWAVGGDELSDDSKIGSLTDIIETPNGILTIDGNFRKLMFWDKSGNLIGIVEDSDIFGSDYPWISDMSLMDDGSILICFTETREDESGDEVILYKLEGF